METEPNSPLDLSREEFIAYGQELIERLADHIDQLRDKKVTPGEPPDVVRAALGGQGLPQDGSDAGEILKEATDLLLSHSLFTGHPRFWGYIVGSGTQIGALADLLAAAVNPNLGGWNLSPIATEIELQTIRWIAEFINYPITSGGILVSGGTMANFVGLLTARRANTPWNVREKGIHNGGGRLRMYCSSETHTWIEKAADLFGHGLDSIRWIPTNTELSMDIKKLRLAIESDLNAGDIPFAIVATAGSVSTGAVDNLEEIADICKQYNIWFHVDAAYGGPAAGLPELQPLFKGIDQADSIALDPHKWFYSPQEVGCVLVRDRQHLIDAFSYHPSYYYFEEDVEEPGVNLYEYGFQNSRGFRALKVWCGFRQAGRKGMQELIRHDIAMAQRLFDLVSAQNDFDPFQVHLSIVTFRYVPPGRSLDEEALNKLNADILIRLQNSGKAFVSNAVVEGRFYMRACIVNHRTREEDVDSVPAIIRNIAGEILPSA